MTGQMRETGNVGEREKGDDMMQRAAGRTQTQAAAARTQPLHMGHAVWLGANWCLVESLIQLYLIFSLSILFPFC